MNELNKPEKPPLTIEALKKDMELRFQSSNGVPVERTAIRAAEWALIKANLK